MTRRMCLLVACGAALAQAVVVGADPLASRVPGASATQTIAGRATPDRDGPRRCQPVSAEALAAPYVFNYGVSPASLQSNFYGTQNDPDDGSYNDKGYRPVRLTGYVDNGQVRFATKWVKDNGPQWTSRFGLTSAQFHARYLTLRAEGYRIIDASGYNTPAGIRYADIWVKNTAGLNWAITRNVAAADMADLKDAMRLQGLAPTRVEGYLDSANAPQFIITWVESPCGWIMEEELTGAQYQAFYNAHEQTKRAIHVDAYARGSLVRFASIFWQQPGPAVRARHGQHWYLFQSAFNKAACDGFAIDTFYGMELADGWNTFGGIWTFRGTPAVSDASSIGTRVGYHVNCSPGRAGAALINVTTGETVTSHGDQVFGTASAIKITVLYALLRKADAEDIDLDTETVGTKTLMTLATEMIVNSNNTSTNTLIDYVGRTTVNDEIAALGLTVTRVRRYLTGGPSAYGLGTWFDDFKAGYDNFSTPRELATFYRKVYENDGLLSADSYSRFLSISLTAPANANDALSAGYDPASVVIYNKAGSKTYTGSPGDFAHRPQLGTHRVVSDAGAMEFANGQVVFYAVMADQTTPGSTVNVIACVGWEAAREWGGADPGNSGGQCVYP